MNKNDFERENWLSFFLPSVEHWSPPPSIVLQWELEVDQGDGDKRGDHQEDAKHNHQDPIKRVKLMSPNSHKDIVNLNGDSAEGKEASHGHLGQKHIVPRKRGNFTGDIAGAAGGFEFSGPVLARDSTEDHQRKAN